MGYTFVVFVLPIWAALSSPEASPDQWGVTQPDVITGPVYVHDLVIWAEWVWTAGRQRRSHHNPLRPYRLSKKQWRRLRRRQYILAQKMNSILDQEHPMPPVGLLLCPARWA